jgi:hypothetical protein
MLLAYGDPPIGVRKNSVRHPIAEIKKKGSLICAAQQNETLEAATPRARFFPTAFATHWALAFA